MARIEKIYTIMQAGIGTTCRPRSWCVCKGHGMARVPGFSGDKVELQHERQLPDLL